MIEVQLLRQLSAEHASPLVVTHLAPSCSLLRIQIILEVNKECRWWHRIINNHKELMDMERVD